MLGLKMTYLKNRIYRKIFFKRQVYRINKGKKNVNCIGVGIIGLGKWGKQYISLINRHIGYQIVAIYDSDLELCKDIANRNKLKIMQPEEMYKNGDIDTLFILVPNHFHYEYVSQAIKCKKNIFVEKPLTNDYLSSANLFELSSDYKQLMYVGHSMKMNKGFKELKRIVDSGKLGDIYQFSCVRSLYGINNNTINTWRGNNENAPFLTLIQLGIHLIDVCNYLFDDLECSYSCAYDLNGVTNSMTCILKNSLINGSLMTCYKTEPTLEFVVYGSKGKVVLDDEKLILYQNDNSKVICSHLNYEDVLLNELEDYYKWRKEGIEPMNLPKRAVYNVKMFEDICKIAEKTN